MSDIESAITARSESGPAAPGQVREISSLTNPAIKALRALHLKKNRESSGQFIAEGLKLVIDALDQGWPIATLVIAKSETGNDKIQVVAARAIARGGDVFEVPAKILSAITRRDNPQMAIGVFQQRYRPLAEMVPESGNVIVALDRIRDPGNLGTILRTVDAAGAAGVILVGETVDPFRLETVRATMGSIFAVPIARAGQQQLIDHARQTGALLIGTHLEAAIDYRRIDTAGRPMILLMGNEQAGLSQDFADSCDVLARIPQAGRADSLNLAIASALMLFELKRDVLRLDP